MKQNDPVDNKNKRKIARGQCNKGLSAFLAKMRFWYQNDP